MKVLYTSIFLLALSISMTAQHNQSMKYKEGDKIHRVAPQMPSFPGCDIMDKKESRKCSDDKMLKYIYSRLDYPAQAREAGIEGRAIIKFIVQKDGTLTNVECIRDPGQGTGDAARGVIQQMITDNLVWNPGMKDGEAVHIEYIMPIQFKLEGKGKKRKSEKAKSEIKEEPVYIPEDAFDINTNDASSFPPPPPPPPAPQEEIFKVVEQMPRFPGCEDQGLTSKELRDCSNEKMVRYIYQELKYPKEARKNGTQGKAIVQFVVQKNGKLKDIKLLRDPGDGCGKAAKNVLDKMSKETTWTPGIQRGRPVNVQFTLPIDFKL